MSVLYNELPHRDSTYSLLKHIKQKNNASLPKPFLVPSNHFLLYGGDYTDFSNYRPLFLILYICVSELIFLYSFMSDFPILYLFLTGK